jgi:anti-sigma factor RsiW
MGEAAAVGKGGTGMKECTDCEINTQLYIDGELTGEEEAEFLFHVKNCSACREAMHEAEVFSRRIRAARPVAEAPASLWAAVSRQMQQVESAGDGPHLLRSARPDRRLRWSLAAAAAVLILAAGGLQVNHRRQENQGEIVIQAAVATHEELQRHALPLDITSGSSQEVSSWFQSRVSFPFRMANSGIASDATAQYKLTGGRLLMVNHEPVALVVFSLPQNLATLLVCPEHLMKAIGGDVINSGGVILHSHDEGPLHVVTWNERGLAYVLTFTAKSISGVRRCTSCHSENSIGQTTPVAYVRAGLHPAAKHRVTEVCENVRQGGPECQSGPEAALGLQKDQAES